MFIIVCFKFELELYRLSSLADLFPGVEPNEEPVFIISEKEQFKTYRDKDGDGFLDVFEVKKSLFFSCDFNIFLILFI